MVWMGGTRAVGEVGRVGSTPPATKRLTSPYLLKWVYVQTGPNEYSELRYVQPALNFDVKTGLPTEDAGEASEHIMVDFLEGEPDKGRISTSVESIHNGAIHGPEMHSKTRRHTTPMCSMLLNYE